MKKRIEMFMEGSKVKTAQSIKGKNILFIKSNKIYRNVTHLTSDVPGLPGFIAFICDGIRYRTNAELAITETA